MADINTEVVGGEQPVRQQRQKHKLDFKEFKLKTTIDDAFYARAHFQEFFRRMGTQLVIVLAVALVAQSIISQMFTNPEVSLFYKIGVVLVAVMSFGVLPWLAKVRWPYMKKNNDFWLSEQRYVLNLKGLSVCMRHGDRRMQWREIRRIFETNEAIVFVIYKFHIVVLPLAEFNEDEKQQIRELILYCTRNMRIKTKLKSKRR